MKKDHTKKNLRKIINIISKMSCDEDMRQELLLYYLEDSSSCNLPKLINKLRITNAVESNKAMLQSILDDDMPSMLEQLSDDQREVILLLESGLSIEEISEYNSMSQTHIQTLINSIGGEYGTKKKSNR